LIVYFGLKAKRCPVCGVRLKPENLGRHISRVHPAYAYGIPKVPVSSKCFFCDRVNDPSKTKYGLPICSKHYVTDIRKFLVPKFYLKLKERNSQTLKENPEIAEWMINYMLNKINSLLTWNPEEISESQYLLFYESSSFAGYLLLRLLEILPELGEILYSISSKEIEEPKSIEFETKINKLFLDMTIEYEFFIGIKFAINGYFDVATDNEDKPKRILIVPIVSQEAADRILLLRLKDANAEWHGTFRKMKIPYGFLTALYETGTSFLFDRKLIMKKFDVFRCAWKRVFGENTNMNSDDFEKFWDLFKWVVCPDGFTVDSQDNATHFDDYKKIGLKKDLIFEVLNQILPDIRTKVDLISTRALSQRGSIFIFLGELARLAHAFKIQSSKGWVYFVSCREWFYNTVMPVFVEFTKSLHLAGQLFEENINLISSLYTKMGVKKKGLSSLGIIIEPKTNVQEQAETIKTSRDLPWRILEKNLPITIPEDEITKKIGNSGELDLLVYANMNLYLIELKALDLRDREAIKHIKEKAPIQCARYARWIKKSFQFKSILQKHGIKDQDYKNVRILICSSGGFNELYVKCSETGEIFAVVPEYILFSVMAGFFTLSVKKSFPSRIETMAPGLKMASEKYVNIFKLDLKNKKKKKISRQLLKWMKFITFDRRRNFESFRFNYESAKSFCYFDATYVLNEIYLEETTNWILPKPLMIGKKNGYKFYIGTQIGNIGSTLVCENCRSAVKYYWPENSIDMKRIQKILERKTCPFCGVKIDTSQKSSEILNMMLMLVTKLKARIFQNT